MSKSKVYFANMRATSEENLQQKLERLIKTAGIGKIDFKNKFAAIKIHFGELGNLAFLRPNYAKTVADMVKTLGGKPFLTDCNTLYVGGRKNALDHMETAYLNGFSPFSTGCHIIIGDGLKGMDELNVPVKGGELVKSAKIGRAIMDADVVISLTHFKGHECTGFGGAVKNLGMGCGSRGGKMEMHCSGKPSVEQKTCVGCGKCTTVCAHGAITVAKKKASINQEKCVGCGRCLASCPVNAIEPDFAESFDHLNKKIAEYTAAVLDGRPHFHISFAIDLSPFCDCHAENDVPFAPDVGMFASFDPVAIDVAAADMINKQPPMPGSMIDGMKPGRDHFHTIGPETNWMVGIDHCVKLGIGSKQYELVTI